MTSHCTVCRMPFEYGIVLVQVTWFAGVVVDRFCELCGRELVEIAQSLTDEDEADLFDRDGILITMILRDDVVNSVDVPDWSGSPA